MPEFRRRFWLQSFAIWTALGLLLVLQTYIVSERPLPGLLPHLFRWAAQMYRAWIWALLTPFVFELHREIRRRHQNLLVIAGLHLLAALTLLAWVNIVRVWALELSFGYWMLEKLSLDNVFALLDARSLVDFYLYWLVLAVGHSLDLVGEKRATALREEQLRTQLAQAELAALRQQVQPHFLFNALNAVAALMRAGEAAKAVEALGQLSTLLRQLLNHGGRPEIELRREFDYAQCYLAVEKVRFEEKLSMQFDADEECLGALVPTLILQPLVENAVKHGISQRRNPGRVTVTARRSDRRLRLQVANDPAEGGRHTSEAENHGIGLSATRTRLARIFGDDQRLDCTFDGPDGTLVTLELPLRFAAAPSPETQSHG